MSKDGETEVPSILKSRPPCMRTDDVPDADGKRRTYIHAYSWVYREVDGQRVWTDRIRCHICGDEFTSSRAEGDVICGPVNASDQS